MSYGNMQTEPQYSYTKKTKGYWYIMMDEKVSIITMRLNVDKLRCQFHVVVPLDLEEVID